jgi:hypothetical protein
VRWSAVLAALLLVASACTTPPRPTPRPSPTPTLQPEAARIVAYVRSLLADGLRAAQLQGWQATRADGHGWRVAARLEERVATWQVASDGTVYPEDALAAELLFGRPSLFDVPAS